MTKQFFHDDWTVKGISFCMRPQEQPYIAVTVDRASKQFPLAQQNFYSQYRNAVSFLLHLYGESDNEKLRLLMHMSADTFKVKNRLTLTERVTHDIVQEPEST